MITKKDFVLSIDKQKPGANYISHNSDNHDQYSNLSFRQNPKRPILISVQSCDKPSKDKYYDSAVSDNYEGKKKLQAWSKSTVICPLKLDVEVQEKAEKQWKKDNSILNASNSTLSLHIAAFENSFETAAFDTVKKRKNKKEILTPSTFFIQNPFEFPRQQDDKEIKPEVSQFKASQRLLDPVGASTNGQQNVSVARKLGATREGSETPPNTTENDELCEIKAKLGFKERPGFEAVLIEIAYRKGPKLGLIIRNYENCVMISRLDAGTLCAEKLLVGDRLVAVDGEAAKEREQTKKIILKGFAKRKKCTFLIERPQSSEAKLWAKTAILSSSTRTSSTAPREKHKWALMAAQQRQAAKLLAAKDARTPQNETGSSRSSISNSIALSNTSVIASTVDVDPPIQINCKRISWPGGPSFKQNWSLPEPIFLYIARNLSSPRCYQKMIQSCKFFFEKNHFLVVTKLEHKSNSEIRVCSFKLDDCSENFGRCCIEINLNKLTSELWFIDEIHFGSYTEDIVSLLRAKTYRCDVNYIYIEKSVLKLNDFKFFASSSAETVLLYRSFIEHDDETDVMLDEIIGWFSNLHIFHWEFADYTSMVNASHT